MIAKGGAKLINQSAIKTLKNKLIKKAYLLTPNIPEAEVLTKIKIKSTKRHDSCSQYFIGVRRKKCFVKRWSWKIKIYSRYSFKQKEKLKFLKAEELKPKTHMEQVVLYLVLLLLFYHVENL